MFPPAGQDGAASLTSLSLDSSGTKYPWVCFSLALARQFTLLLFCFFNFNFFLNLDWKTKMLSRILGNSCMISQQGAYLLPLAKGSCWGCQNSKYRANWQKLAGSYNFYPKLTKNGLCSPHSLCPLPSWDMLWELLCGYSIFELYYQIFPNLLLKTPPLVSGT